MFLVQKTPALQSMCPGIIRGPTSFVTTQSSPINPPCYLCLTNLFQGNAELLSISSDDSIWKSEDEDIGDTKSEGKHEHLFL